MQTKIVMLEREADTRLVAVALFHSLDEVKNWAEEKSERYNRSISWNYEERSFKIGLTKYCWKYVPFFPKDAFKDSL